MAIAVTNQIDGAVNSSVDASSYVSGSLTPSSNVLLVFALAGMNVSSVDAADPTSIVWNGVTATKITSFQYDTTGTSRRKIWLYALNTGTAAASVVTYTLSETWICAVSNCFEVTGSDVVNGVAQTFVQTATTPVNPIANTTDSITLAAASHADNRSFSMWHRPVNEDTTHRTNWTEISDLFSGAGSDGSGVETQWRSDTFETTASASWATSIIYGGIAFEIKALAAGGGATVLDPFGMAGFFGA